ncbi:DUF4232 domain-containing protein [Streptomyces sp. NPDC006739]|uniref:DUF4232 domain-containing protein n=1 Tax=Streptomyces sp. NPDC006739 TaxID=3364763 RepID=UPI0036C955A0
MRAMPLTVTALTAALLLTACNGGGGGGGGGSKSKQASGGSDSSACKVGGVSLQVGSASVAPSVGDTGEVPVSITNQSAPCTLDGFANVDLRQDGVSDLVDHQAGAKPQKLKLNKGDSASFTISYVRGKTGDKLSLDAQKMLISLPGSTATQTFPWKYGSIAGKGQAANLKAGVSAFQQVGD